VSIYLLCAPQTVRVMLGHGCLKANTPSTSFPKISSPETGSMMAGSMPKKGRDALPGLVGVTPARGVITLEPVSVCQYVYLILAEISDRNLEILTSTTCASSFPTISKYHFQTSAAIGSPTEPRTLRCFICALT